MKAYNSKKRQTKEINYESDDQSFRSHVTNEVGKQTKLASDDFWKQLLGHEISPQENTNEGIVFDLSKFKKTNKDRPHSERKTRQEAINIAPGIEYHRDFYETVSKYDEKALRRETMQESRQIHQIMMEIKKLVTSTRSLQAEFGTIALEESPVTPGKYYTNFFEWMFIMLRQARQKIEDSKCWLETVKAKKKKKLGYWGMAKKHGTMFSQANERFVATSTG